MIGPSPQDQPTEPARPEEESHADKFELKTVLADGSPRKTGRSCRQRLVRWLLVLTGLIVLVIGIAVAGAFLEGFNEGFTGSLQESEITTGTSSSVWQPKAYRVTDVFDSSFGARGRHTFNLVAPEAVTKEQRLATLRQAALDLYSRREIEDAAALRLFEVGRENAVARVVFAADRCGWTGEDCGRSYWSDAKAVEGIGPLEDVRVPTDWEQRPRR